MRDEWKIHFVEELRSNFDARAIREEGDVAQARAEERELVRSGGQTSSWNTKIDVVLHQILVSGETT